MSTTGCNTMRAAAKERIPPCPSIKQPQRTMEAIRLQRGRALKHVFPIMASEQKQERPRQATRSRHLRNDGTIYLPDSLKIVEQCRAAMEPGPLRTRRAASGARSSRPGGGRTRAPARHGAPAPRGVRAHQRGDRRGYAGCRRCELPAARGLSRSRPPHRRPLITTSTEGAAS